MLSDDSPILSMAKQVSLHIQKVLMDDILSVDHCGNFRAKLIFIEDLSTKWLYSM